MEELIITALFGLVGAGAGSLVTLWVQARRHRADPTAAAGAARLHALDAGTLDRVVTALDRFDRRLEAVEQRMEFSEKLLIQPSARGADARERPEMRREP